MAYTLLIVVTTRKFCGGEIAIANTSQTVGFDSQDAAIDARRQIEDAYCRSSDDTVRVILLKDTK